MVIQRVAVLAFVALLPLPVAAQNAATVMANASKAMGVEGLDSVHFYGSGANDALGQSNNANGPWPRTNLNDNLTRLGINADRIMSVHTLNPDRLTSLAEIQKTLGR